MWWGTACGNGDGREGLESWTLILMVFIPYQKSLLLTLTMVPGVEEDSTSQGRVVLSCPACSSFS
jgi:hypothetical protein